MCVRVHLGWKISACLLQEWNKKKKKGGSGNDASLHSNSAMFSSLAAFYWERSSCITGLAGALCTATVYSLSSLLSFSFCFIVSSLVVLSLSNCPHLEQAAFFCHLFYVSLFLSISSSTLLCLWYVRRWSLLVIFSHSFRRLPHFYLHFCVYVPTPFLFIVLFFLFGFEAFSVATTLSIT